MPPLSTKGKGKVKDGRQSRSRNTTPSSVPSSVVSGPVSTGQVPCTFYLEIPKASLNVLTSTSYDNILEKYKAGVLPDAQQIIALATDVRILADAAATRGTVCDGGMRELSARRREKLLEEERAEEQAAREAEEKEIQKRIAAEEAEMTAKMSKPKKKQQQKERSRVREERPLTHGAHGVARQDGLAAPPSAIMPSSTKWKRQEKKQEVKKRRDKGFKTWEWSPMVEPLTPTESEEEPPQTPFKANKETSETPYKAKLRSSSYHKDMGEITQVSSRVTETAASTQTSSKTKKKKKKKKLPKTQTTSKAEGGPVQILCLKNLQSGGKNKSLMNVAGPSSPQPVKPQVMPVSGSVAPDRKEHAPSGSSSSLSPASQMHSPLANPPAQQAASTRPTPSRNSSDSSLDSHQPMPAPRVVQMQRFGSNPLTSDDSTIYHVRKVTDDMPDEEKKEIYGVTQFPRSDLRHLIAGTPPDKDFSNAKPNNQVNFNTFNTYVDSYLRPLVEEDMNWLKEKGDRVTPFLMPPRGKRHYKDIWAEEDGTVNHDASKGITRPTNQARGNIDQLNDETAEGDSVSAGPVLNRLLTLMRPGQRVPKEDDKDKATNGAANGAANDTSSNADPLALNFDDMTMDMDTTAVTDANTLPSATFMPESTQYNWRVPPPITDYAVAEESVLAELRYCGFLPPDAQLDYDAHYDDEVAERLRILQNELKRVSIENAAYKARILQAAEVHMAHQEYKTILDDLDNQVTQLYVKRSRSQGKSKKGNKKPGGAGGGSHAVTGGSGSAVGVTKPVIGDHARTLIQRRKDWMETISPVFDDVDLSVPTGPNSSIFQGEEWEAILQKEKERFDEEAE